MKNISGFPVAFAGGEKFTQQDIGVVNDDEIDFLNDNLVQGADLLAQNIMLIVLGMPTDDRATPERAAQTMLPIIKNAMGKNIDSIVAVRAEGREMEIEFVASGYPGRYVKRLHLDGRGGRYPCRHLPPNS